MSGRMLIQVREGEFSLVYDESNNEYLFGMVVYNGFPNDECLSLTKDELRTLVAEINNFLNEEE